MTWKNVFSLYVFRFIQNIKKILLNKDIIFFPFNTIIDTKKNSMFVTFQEDMNNTQKKVTCETYLGEKKIQENISLSNNVNKTITTHTIKYLEIAIMLNGQYRNYNNPAYIFTKTGEIIYTLYVGDEIFKITIYPFRVIGVSVNRDDAFILGQVNCLYSSPDYLELSFSSSFFYTNQEEINGLNIKINRPIKNTLGHTINWHSETQLITSIKYWDVDDGEIVETPFDGIYFDNL